MRVARLPRVGWLQRRGISTKFRTLHGTHRTPDGDWRDAVSEKYDLDLGDGHWLKWTEFHGVRCGGIIYHTDSKAEDGICCGSFWTDKSYNESSGTNHAIWSINGGDEKPTLSPSFLCHCGDHGFIRDGKWVRA